MEIPPILATTVFSATRACDFSSSFSAFQFHLAEADLAWRRTITFLERYLPDNRSPTVR